MKILFIERIVEYIDPLHVELLSALARREGHTTFFAILQDNNLEEKLKKINPDIIALSAKTGEHIYCLEAAKTVKKFNEKIFTILGGPHCTFFPEIIENDAVDAIGFGECDTAWPELLRAFESGKTLSNIKNIFTKKNWYGHFQSASQYERLQHLNKRMTIEELDKLPFLDRELVYTKTHLKEFPMRSFISSRGCPFECTYCFEPKFNEMYRGKGPAYNRYSVKRLCAELKEIKERWPVQFFKFYDDIFWTQKKVDSWLTEFAEIYPKEVGIPFFCLTRCNILTEEHLKLLKPAGLHSITMSIEAGNDYIRNNVIKRHMTREEILNAFKLCEKYKIVTFANTIMGIPVKPEIMAEHGKTAIDYDIESLDINIQCKVTFGEFGTIYPYPGTKLTEYVVNNGWFNPKTGFNNLHTSYQSESPLSCFSDKEKMMQNNLTLLGTVCLLMPWMRNLVVKYLIKLPIPKFYFIFYFLTKGYLNIFKVYPMKFSLMNFLRNLFRSFKIEIKKHSPGKRLYQEPKIKKISTAQMFSGTPKL